MARGLRTKATRGTPPKHYRQQAQSERLRAKRPVDCRRRAFGSRRGRCLQERILRGVWRHSRPTRRPIVPPIALCGIRGRNTPLLRKPKETKRFRLVTATASSQGASLLCPRKAAGRTGNHGGIARAGARDHWAPGAEIKDCASDKVLVLTATPAPLTGSAEQTSHHAAHAKPQLPYSRHSSRPTRRQPAGQSLGQFQRGLCFPGFHNAATSSAQEPASGLITPGTKTLVYPSTQRPTPAPRSAAGGWRPGDRTRG